MATTVSRAAAAAAVLLACPTPSTAQDYAVSPHLVAAGGGPATGGTYALVASVGQPAAANEVSFGGTWALLAGIWHSASPSAAPPFVDPVLTPGASLIRLIHVAELRQRIDAVRVRHGLRAFAWTDPALVAGVTIVRAIHFSDLRNALAQAYSAVGLAPPPFPGSVAPGLPVTAGVIAELRTAVAVLE